MERASVVERIWYESAVPIFLERFILPVLAAGLIAVIVLNPFKLDGHRRVALLVVVIGLAYFVARTIQITGKEHTGPLATPEVPTPHQPAQTTTPKSQPVIEQKATESTCSNVVAGKDANINCSPEQEKPNVPKHNPKGP